MLGTIEFGRSPGLDETPMTLEELRESAGAFLASTCRSKLRAGPDRMRCAGSTGRTAAAATYREGTCSAARRRRACPLGDGWAGLNLGLQDAVNLGWKLAAEVNGWAPDGLLDTYDSERRPVGERVMMQSLSQTALMAPGPEIEALRTLLGELMEQPSVGRTWRSAGRLRRPLRRGGPAPPVRAPGARPDAGRRPPCRRTVAHAARYCSTCPEALPRRSPARGPAGSTW